MIVMKRLLELPPFALLVSCTAALAAPQTPGPLFDGLGNHHQVVSTRSPKAQRYFDQGLMLCYAFNHTEAIRSFRSAAQIDPDCAMAWWGVAYAFGPHVNKPMTKEDNQGAWEALQQAVARRGQASPREQAYIDAIAQRYQAEFNENRATLDKAYAHAMQELAAQYPDDLDAQVLKAEALMDTMPWDYWLKDRRPKPETEEALAALRDVMRRDPKHPGANHFYIHAVEAGPAPELGLPAADRLGAYAPEAGHLVHMPSHIYMRVGQYHDAAESNERAVRADQQYVLNCAAQGFYPGLYYPHNVHFLWYATLFEGRSAEALRAANRATQYANDNICGPIQVLEAPRFRHLPWLTWARFGRWDEILRIPEPPATNSFLVDRVMWHYTRGLAFVAHQDPDAAANEQTQMVRLIHSDRVRELENPHFPAGAVLAIPEHLLAGKIAGARGDVKEMISSLQLAVSGEDALPYMEPAFWPIPTRPTLAAAWLTAGDPVKAEAVFREDLKRWPRNGWSLFGLEQSLRKQGKVDSAENVRRELDEAWKYADVRLDLASF
jgi:tetratricopeptide (TPR) repeat protein